MAWLGCLGCSFKVASGFDMEALPCPGFGLCRCDLAWLGSGGVSGAVDGGFGLGAFGTGVCDEPESLILAQSERWRHA